MMQDDKTVQWQKHPAMRVQAYSLVTESQFEHEMEQNYKARVVTDQLKWT